jgi:hypothetical protein
MIIVLTIFKANIAITGDKSSPIPPSDTGGIKFLTGFKIGSVMSYTKPIIGLVTLLSGNGKKDITILIKIKILSKLKTISTNLINTANGTTFPPIKPVLQLF